MHDSSPGLQAATGDLPTVGSNAVEILINDHQIIKRLLAELTEAQQTSVRADVLEQLKAVLTIHNATEENLVYPALAVVAGKKTESAKLYNETAEADKLVFELDTMVKEGDDSHFASKAKKLQAAILEHMSDEEDKAFPHLQKNSEPQQSELLTRSVRQFRSSFHYRPAAV